MTLKDKLKAPVEGWKYLDPDLKTWVEGSTFEGLVQNVMEIRLNKGMSIDNFLRQMIEDQICDRLPKSECTGASWGDAVHAVAKPIAKVLDKTLKTNFTGCGACAKRRAKLNS